MKTEVQTSVFCVQFRIQFFVFDPISEETLEMDEKEGGTNSGSSLFVNRIKLKVELEIKDKTGTQFCLSQFVWE